MKRRFSVLAVLALSLVGAACSPENINPSESGEGDGGDDINKTEVSITVGADNLSAISVVLKGKANFKSSVSSDLRIGFQYSKQSGILPSNSTIVDAEEADSNYNYSTVITGLEPGTTYYFRSFVRQNGMDEYGETKPFTTKELSSLLATQDATEIEAKSAKLNGTLDFSNLSLAYKYIEYGFYWGTSEASQTRELSGEVIVENAYSASLSNLGTKTQYWYKAYVKLDTMVFYGEVKPFTTDVIKVESVSLNIKNYTFNKIGNTITLSPTVLPADATDKSVEWTSSDNNVAKVTNSGFVEAVGNGVATIIVTTKDQSKTDTCAITVAQLVTSISLNKNTTLLLNEGEDFTFTASVNPDNAADKVLKWTSSNESVATVDQTGKVTAISEGAATIKAESQDGSGKYDSCKLTVYAPYTAFAVEAVDLGLSVKWSSCNLGSTKPEEYGDYFAWGETRPKDNYAWTTYKWCNGSLSTLIRYNTVGSYGTVDNKMEFKDYDYVDDVAREALGGNWRTPTIEEWTELKNNCTWTWTGDYKGTGVAGIIMTSNKTDYTDKSIFLPVAGHRYDFGFRDKGVNGFYWSSCLHSDQEPSKAEDFFLSRNLIGIGNWNNRFYGESVRPVCE
ncbi:MAG: Ig-like domain-containing protein [Bacteroidales bacterium]|nr:Ig-like domain-containing protein [Bacteroidales bacterium]